jgi:GTPase Era involved in 16S rRNA processing
MNVEIRKQVRQAIDEADLLLFVVDAKVGAHPSDARIVDLLRESGKPFLLIANKVDDPSSTDFYDFYRLGAGEPVPVSATNGKQSGDLLDVVNEHLPATDEQLPEALRVAVIGRPNVGKSSFVNRCSARTGSSSATSPAPRATRSTRRSSTTAATSSSSTPRGCAARARWTTASSSTRRCAPAGRSTAPTSASCSSTRRSASRTRTSRSRRSRGSRAAR